MGALPNESSANAWNRRLQSGRRETAVITLRNAQRDAVRTWTLANAWPTTILGGPGSSGDEFAVEWIDPAYDGGCSWKSCVQNHTPILGLKTACSMSVFP